MPDFSALSDAELTAAMALLGEQAQEISDATALVRAEQQRRAAPVAMPVVLGDYGTTALNDAVTGAPARAKEIADAESAAAAAVAEPASDG